MRIEKPTIPEVVERFTQYYERPGNGAWGSLHIVLDDDNTQDSHVQFCIDFATERGDTEGAELARVLLKMSRTQRRKMCDAVWEFQKKHAERRAE